MKVGTFVGGWLAAAADEARQAESSGYDYIACDESHHDSMLTMTVAAASTTRVELQTAITVAFARSPMVLAMEAWDLQQLSRGRFVLGLGTQWPDHSERRLSVPWEPPIPRMREYVQCLRAIWATFQEDAPPDFVGRHYRFQLMTRGYNPGPIEFARPKVFIGAGRPAMARLAGELADGFPYVRVTEKYMREVLLPHVRQGLQKAGRTWQDIELTESSILLLGKDERAIEEKWPRIRRLIATAFLPGSHMIGPRDEIFALHGWHDLAEQLRALGQGGRREEMERVIPEEVLRGFADTCTYDRFPEFLRQHREYARRVFLSMPMESEEDRALFHHIRTEIQQIETPGVPAGLALS